MNSPHVIILAARGVRILPETVDSKFHTSLEWLIHAFTQNQLTNITIIGGKEINALAEKYPQLDFRFNPQWEEHGTISSLALAEDVFKKGSIVTYVDVVYRPELVAKLLNEKEGDIKVVTDTNWRQRYPNRSQSSLQKAEKVIANEKLYLKEAGRKFADWNKVTGEIAGLMYFSPKGARALMHLYKNTTENKKLGFTDALHELAQTKKVDIKVIKTAGEWAELDEPQDFGRFVFGTKSQTLERLRQLLKNGVILPQYACTLAEWKNNPQGVITGIRKQLSGPQLVVRSSTTAEDALEASCAGMFTSVLCL